MLNVQVNNFAPQTITSEDLQALDLQTTSSGNLHLLQNGKSYNIEVVEIDHAAKTATVKVNGNTYTVTAEDELDLMLKKLGIGAGSSQKLNHIKAPMPGLVLQFSVSVGQHVRKGDAVLILEAMKMENNIKSPADGIVKSIKAKQGDAVDKGQILIEFE